MKRFVKQLLLALDCAHGLGIIHTGMFIVLECEKYKSS
jgi:hypothetical protein